MYGMVNLAVEQLICENHGIETWNQIKTKAGISVPKFIIMESYDDEITYNLVREASEVLGVSKASLLETFGEYFIMYTAKEGYGDLLKSGGNSLPEYLNNLNMTHFRLKNMLPNMISPKFNVTNITDYSLVLTYISNRNGLEYMLIGIIKGLGNMLNTPCKIEFLGNNSQIEDALDFSVSW